METASHPDSAASASIFRRRVAVAMIAIVVVVNAFELSFHHPFYVFLRNLSPAGGTVSVVDVPQLDARVYTFAEGVQGMTYDVELSRRFRFPQPILQMSTEKFYGPGTEEFRDSPRSEALALVVSQDGRRTAFVFDGWYVDLYDAEGVKSKRFLPGLHPSIDRNELLAYHNLVTSALGANPTVIDLRRPKE